MSDKFKDVAGLEVVVLDPTFPEATDITQEDVWGKWLNPQTKVHNGMVAAKTGDKCPVWGDKVPYKSVTVICASDLREQVAYWLEFVHGSDCIANVCDLDNGRVAFRSDYQAW